MFLPGIVEILADSELVFLAISSDKLIILETLIPAAGSNSFKVTTGPWLTFFIFPSTPKSRRIFSKKSELTSSSFEDFCLSFFVGNFNKLIEGKINFDLVVLVSIVLLINGKSSWIVSLFSVIELICLSSLIKFFSFLLNINLNITFIKFIHEFNLKLTLIKNNDKIIIIKI